MNELSEDIKSHLCGWPGGDGSTCLRLGVEAAVEEIVDHVEIVAVAEPPVAVSGVGKDHEFGISAGGLKFLEQ